MRYCPYFKQCMLRSGDAVCKVCGDKNPKPRGKNESK